MKGAVLVAVIGVALGSTLRVERSLSNLFHDEAALEHFRSRGKNGFLPLSPTEQVKEEKPKNLFGRPDGTTEDEVRKENSVAQRNQLPEQVDWRARMSDVKFQGACGVCWAFVATAMVEFRLAVDYSIPSVSLSEQHLLDCNKLGVNNGCLGGNHYSALKGWNGYFFSGEAYPFITDEQGQQKHQDEMVSQSDFCAKTYVEESVARLVLFENYLATVEPQTEYALMEAVAKGPVGVAISGYSDAFIKYEGGVLGPEHCGEDVDHAAVVVGYGTTEDGEDYWLVRNSWSTAWGENGHIRLKRFTQSAKHRFGTCGILYQANYLLPGAVACVLPTGESCLKFSNKQFCTKEHGCQSEEYYASKVSLSTVTSPNQEGETTNGEEKGGINLAIIIPVAVASALLIASVGYILFTRSSSSSNKQQHMDTTLAVHIPQPHTTTFAKGATKASPEAIQDFRDRLRGIEATRRRASRESEDVIVQYLAQNAGDVSAAVNEYIACET